MIQRKQTLFLLATAIIAIITLFVPFLTIDLTADAVGLSLVEGLKHPEAVNKQIYFPLILNCLVIVVSLVTIFQFKNRVLQYKLANLALLFSIFVTGLFFLLNFFDGNAAGVHFTFGAFLPIVGGGFAFLAAVFIKKDEQLVRNSNRIR
jgi:glucan phosphoethanolaminetransferase (alkaline phosphatase superfamily)